MTEEKINAFRQTDANLRDALKMDEAERPQMPADLNERLMQRMAVEEKKPRRIVWPWIAAACVAGVMIVWLTPPKTTGADVVAENTAVEQPMDNTEVEEPQVVKAETEATAPIPTPVKVNKAKLKSTVVKRDADPPLKKSIRTWRLPRTQSLRRKWSPLPSATFPSPAQRTTNILQKR